MEQVVPFLATKRVRDGESLAKKKNMKPSVFGREKLCPKRQ